MNYSKAVAEAKKLIRVIEEGDAAGWRLAELCHEVVEVEGRKAGEWAKDIGKTQGYVQTLRKAWQKYGSIHKAGRADRSFNDYLWLAKSSPEQAEALTVTAEALGLSVRQTAGGYGDVVASVRKALSDPEMAHDVLQDQGTRASVAKASMGIAAELVHEQRQAQQRRAPDVSHRSQVYDILGRLVTARRQVVTTLDQLRHMDLDDDDRELLAEVIGELANAVEWYQSYISSGERSFDRELDRLLSEGT